MIRLSIPTKLIKTGLITLCLLSPTAALAVGSNTVERNSDAQYEQTQPSEAQLAQMLAPIALYPDSLLTHILIAATYPLEIVQARRWEQQHNSLSSEQKMQQAELESWDPSVTALVAFPTVLEKLNEDLNWTQELGEAFLLDEAMVLASIQILRQQADEADSFNEMDNMTVTRVEKQIIIEPAQPEVIYVPVYDPRVVYGHWRWHAYPPVYWHYPAYAYYRPHRPIYWGPSVYINFNYFFGAVHWSHHRVVVVNHRNTRYYRKPHKIAYSTGSQRWKHKPAHRRGVAYKAPKVSHRYDKKRYNTASIAHKPAHKAAHKSSHKPAIKPVNSKHKTNYAKQTQQSRVNKALKDNKRNTVSHNKSVKNKSVNQTAKVNHNRSNNSSNYKSPSYSNSQHKQSSQRASTQRSSTQRATTQRSSNQRAATQRSTAQSKSHNRSSSKSHSSHRSSAPQQKAR
ncbi:DUF3300 domain-containing protein [Shewanella sp. KT0246]|uniref:DUF3300 domain-containing protein n=1 Tax=Shewanella sp. KT0246 TaxID=2815912 RepID=UPI001BC683F3|nr:DUF3300 domain-containing protein [Shewanella sp. KT0246]GIU50655.1 hypothetical protein TUM4249_12120 [Shewanella sp. KT0246]